MLSSYLLGTGIGALLVDLLVVCPLGFLTVQYPDFNRQLSYLAGGLIWLGVSLSALGFVVLELDR